MRPDHDVHGCDYPYRTETTGVVVHPGRIALLAADKCHRQDCSAFV
jgi:hypothetical protein